MPTTTNASDLKNPDNDPLFAASVTFAASKVKLRRTAKTLFWNVDFILERESKHGIQVSKDTPIV